MENKDKARIEELENKLIEFEDKVEELTILFNNYTRNKKEYANKDVFDSPVTFKKPVYNRFGERVIN